MQRKSTRFAAMTTAVILGAGTFAWTADAQQQPGQQQPGLQQPGQPGEPGVRPGEPRQPGIQPEARPGEQIEDPAAARPDEMPDAKQFIKSAATVNALETVLAALATERSEDQQVRQFAERIKRDHTQATQQLNQLARQKQVRVPTEQIQRLLDAEGSAFDRAFIQYVTQQHQEAVKTLQQISQQHPDQEIQQFAREMLPTMQRHLQEAQRLQTQVGTAIRDPAGAERPDQPEREEQLERDPERERPEQPDTP